MVSIFGKGLFKSSQEQRPTGGEVQETNTAFADSNKRVEKGGEEHILSLGENHYGIAKESKGFETKWD